MSIHESLTCMLNVLPLHAEEGSVREIVSENEFLAAMTRCPGPVDAYTVVQTVRSVFEALAVLDLRLLNEGKWAFVSFPASLAARSILSTLATPSQTLVPFHYWEQGTHRSPSVVEEQRTLLKTLETRRQRFHPTKSAQPIRTVHVAWGVIKIGGRFLMVRRDDKLRNGAGDFVFPGGRFNLSDIPSDQQGPQTLRNLYRIDSDVAAGALNRTLVRELEEECGLLVDHYFCGQPISLPHYERVEGAGNQHGMTQYNIAVYPISLTDEGQLQLLCIEADQPEQFEWFTLDELLLNQRADGKKAFIDAIRTMETGKAEHLLGGLASSIGIDYAYTKETEAIDLPASHSDQFLSGKTGKESAIAVDLDADMWGLMLLLGWHSKSLPVSADPSKIQLLGNGWVKLASGDSLAVAEQLSLKLKLAGLPGLILRGGIYCRLQIHPDHVYLGRGLFKYHLPIGDSDLPITISLAEVVTIWGKLGSTSVGIELPRNMVRVIRSIQSPDDVDTRSIKGEDLPRQIRGIFQSIQNIGLRKFIYVEKGSFRLSLAPGTESLR
jgi:8-oxo-dGTP pyrophosphatase MutT (NUDIX family)